MGRKLAALLMTAALCLTAAYAAAQEVSTSDELKNALDAANDKNLGKIVITIAPNTTIKGSFTIAQNSGTDVIIKGDGKTTIINGRLLIDGNSRSTGKETLLVSGIVFDGTGVSGDYLLGQNSKQSADRYPHNVIVENCTFKNNQNMPAIKARSSFGTFAIKNCTADGMMSLFWGTGCEDVRITDTTVTRCGNGVLTGTSKNVTIEKSHFDVSGAAIVMDLNNSHAVSLTAKNNVISSDQPFVFRNEGSKKAHQMNAVGNTYSMLTADQADQVVTFMNKATADMISGEEVACNPQENRFLNPANASEKEVSALPKTGDTSSLLLRSLLLAAAMGGVFLMKKRSAVN